MNSVGKNKTERVPEKATITVCYPDSQDALVEFDVLFTKEQARQYMLLENDDERSAFLKEIVFGDPVIKDELVRKMVAAFKDQKS